MWLRPTPLAPVEGEKKELVREERIQVAMTSISFPKDKGGIGVGIEYGFSSLRA